MHRELEWSVRYMMWQVGLKGALTGALWTLAIYSVSDLGYLDMIGWVSSGFFLGLIAVIVGSFAGGILGGLVAIVYNVLHMRMLRTETNLRQYRQMLTGIGGVMGFVCFALVMGLDDLTTIIGFSAAVLAAAGTAVSGYTYLPAYMAEFGEQDKLKPN